MPQISLMMTPLDCVQAVAQGNFGAVRVCAEAIKHGSTIDPDAAFGGLGVILTFDDRGIYGSQIWQLYKNVCGEDIGKVLALLRADQLGQLAGVTTAKIRHAIDNRGEGIDVEAAVAAVRERLPLFDPSRRAEEVAAAK